MAQAALVAATSEVQPVLRTALNSVRALLKAATAGAPAAADDGGEAAHERSSAMETQLVEAVEAVIFPAVTPGLLRVYGAAHASAAAAQGTQMSAPGKTAPDLCQL